MDKAPYSADAHPPREIAHMVERLGVAKAQTDVVTLVVLAVLAGAFISLGALFFTVVVTDASLGFGLTVPGNGSVRRVGRHRQSRRWRRGRNGNPDRSCEGRSLAWRGLRARRAVQRPRVSRGVALDQHGAVSVVGVARNLAAVSAGNIVGGTLLVAGVYWVAYLRGERKREGQSP